MRILMITARYLPFWGGIETHVNQVGRRMVKAGHQVTVLTTDPIGDLPSSETLDGLSVIRVPALPRGRDYNYAPDLASAIGSLDYDVAHVQGCHTFVPILASRILRREAATSLITFHSGGHSSKLRRSMRGVQWAACRPFFSALDHFIGVSRFEAEYFTRVLRLPHERVSIIRNGAEMPDAGDAVGGRSHTIVSVGRLERYKGHHRLVAALPHVLRRLPQARLRILGDGPYRQHLVDQSEMLGISDRVEIRRFAPDDRVGLSQAISNAGVVGLLSDYEANPVAVMEALALRQRVLVAPGTGFDELAEEGFVETVPFPDDPVRVADMLVRTLTSVHVPKDFKLPTWDDCTQATLAAYEKAVASRAAAGKVNR